MTNIKKKWDLLNPQKKQSFIPDIITFFENNYDEEIWILAAEEVLDFFLENIALDIYNRWIEDSKELLRGCFQDLEVDLEMLKK